MIKPLIIAAALLAPAAALAASAEREFTQDGQTYRYSVDRDAQGRQVLTGRNLSRSVAFRYVIADGRVTGFNGEVPVSFRIAKPAGSTVAADLVAAN